METQKSITPVRRLGTMRRRSIPMTTELKVGKSPCMLVTTPVRDVKTFKRCFNADTEKDEPVMTSAKMLKPNPEKSDEPSDRQDISSECYLLELERKLEHMSNVAELEDDIKMWRTGCKEALLELQTWLSDKEGVKMSCKKLACELGIWTVVKEQFKGDSDMLWDDDDDPTDNINNYS